MARPKKPTYDSDAILLLSDIEQVRAKPSMWVGDPDQIGHFIIAKEIIDNALDEAICGHASKITVTMDADNRGVTVADNGRGIPFTKHAKSGVSSLATVFLFTKSGGKYNKDAYDQSIGTHGVGSTCTNALSEVFEATSVRDGKIAKVRFQRGVMDGKDAVVTDAPPRSKSGTTVHFRPDYRDIFKDVTGYDPAQIRQRLVDAAAMLDQKIKIEFVSGGSSETIQSGGISSLLDKKGVPSHWTAQVEIPTQIDGRDFNIKADLAWGWADDETQSYCSFVNLSRTPDGGQHLLGCQNAIADFMVERSKNKCSAKEILDNLHLAVHVIHPAPIFPTQTKDKLNNKGLAKQISDALAPELKSWARKNTAEVDAVITAAIKLFDERESAKDLKKAIKDLKTTKRSSRGILPTKLFEADCAPSKRELYLVEGDSAAGSAVRGRDASFQEILPLKGKILNAFRASDAELLGNAEVAAIMAAVGGGFGSKFAMSDVRVGKIILLSDGDHDGFHISSLILSLFAKHMPQLLSSGMVYMVDSPLFKASLPGTKTRWFGYTMADIKTKAGKDFGKCDITRLKGHGEANYDEVAEYAMRANSRRLIQLSAAKADTAEIEKVMGNDVMSRKELLGVDKED